jgi:putative ABC transport system substrate-binding protein
MKRRQFIAAFGAAAVWPFAALAQQAIPVIGYLGSESADRFASRLRAFRQGLLSVGYEEGRNVRIEYRWADGRNERLPDLATDLARREVSVIVAPGNLVAALAAKAATSTIPVVFEVGADPVANGLVASMNRPGGNVTGITSLNSQVAPKRLELLREIMPEATTFALLVNPTNPKNAESSIRDLQEAARALSLQIEVLNASTESDFEAVFSSVAQLRAGGLVIANDIFFNARHAELAALSFRHLVAAAHQSREFTEAGGLISYGGSFAQSHGQAGVYAGRILRGEKPAELPVHQVTKVELIVNPKTAKALGLTIPLPLLARADEVIE